MDLFAPIQQFADWFTYRVLFIPADTLLAEAVNFFIFDTLKIFLLLTVIIFGVSLVRSFLPPEKTRKILSHKNKYLGNVLAAFFGIFTPFCSCSAVPLFFGFLQAGVPLGAVFSFLISSPMINEIALVMLLGMFGWKVALIYIGSGFVIAVVSGIVIGNMNVASLIHQKDLEESAGHGHTWEGRPAWGERLRVARLHTLWVIKRVWLYIILGIGIGAWMHGYVPADLLARWAGADKWYAVPVATLIGVPLYSNAAGVMPLVSVLVEKGVSMGTALAFMMAVTALSVPEFAILKRIMRVKLLVLFAGIVACGIIFTGYLFNLILK